MKYRIVIGSDDRKPFVVKHMNEKSFLKMWWYVEKFSRQHEAESFIKRSLERRANYPEGQVLLEYDESDLIVDRLKNQHKVSEGVGSAEPQQDATIKLIKHLDQK